jgi:hypothetical protein
LTIFNFFVLKVLRQLSIILGKKRF